MQRWEGKKRLLYTYLRIVRVPDKPGTPGSSQTPNKLIVRYKIMASKVYDYVTDQITKMLSEGTIPWKMPWLGESINYVTRKQYRGINMFLFRRPGEYMTYKQCTEAGGKVKKGAKSQMVVFYKISKFVDEKGDEVKGKKSFLLRYYSVFHIDDCEGVKSKIKPLEAVQPIPMAESIIKNYTDCPPLSYLKPGQAFYRPSDDIINIPPIERYPVVEEYYSTLFHEAAHSTGHKKRLDRKDSTFSFYGSEDYSKEELIAEFTASMLCSVCKIEQKTLQNSAAYIKSWLKVLKDDKKMLVQAASAAQKAADYIRGIKAVVEY